MIERLPDMSHWFGLHPRGIWELTAFEWNAYCQALDKIPKS